MYGSISLALGIGVSAAKWSEVHSLFLMALVFCIPGLAAPIVALGEGGLIAMIGAGLGVYIVAGLPLTLLGWSMALTFIEEHARPG